MGCDYSPVYTVSQAEEGIVTQNGKIAGEPKKPGLHFKLPLIQQVHLINVHSIRVMSFQIPKVVKIKVFWNIKDSKQYFSAIQRNNDPQFGGSIISLEFDKLMNEYDQNSSSSFERLKEQLQLSVNDDGIKILNVQIENK